MRRLLELFVLTAFAITQPLLDVTGRAPEFFVFHRAERTDIVLFVLVVTFAPTLVLWVVEQVVGLAGEVARRAVHLLFVTLLLTALAIQVAKKLIPDRGYSLLALGLVLGAAATVLLLRSSTARTFLTYLTPAPLIFALLFLLTTPVGALVTSSTTASTARASGGGARPPIVMIYFDEFPTLSLLNSKGLVDERVYPNFARLQQDSVWFRHATGVAGWTPEALPPMLTGQYATKKLAPSYVQFPDNLFTLLSDDYRVVASESVAQLCPPTECKPAPLQRDTGLLPVLRESTATARLLVSPLKSTVEPGDQFAEAEESGEQAAASRRSRTAPTSCGSAGSSARSTSRRGSRTSSTRSRQATSPRCTSCTSCCRTRPSPISRPVRATRTSTGRFTTPIRQPPVRRPAASSATASATCSTSPTRTR